MCAQLVLVLEQIPSTRDTIQSLIEDEIWDTIWNYLCSIYRLPPLKQHSTNPSKTYVFPQLHSISIKM
jgi:hypothetical protein